MFILGAGFSSCAGIPVQSEFAQLLLSDEFSSEADKAITRTLRDFLNHVFGWHESATFPALEDIFTCIDLSAGTGHHLGIKYTPKVLRAIRRMAIYRIFSVLDRHFHYSTEIDRLLRAHTAGALQPPGFLVLNWDIVLEKHLARLDPPILPEYVCEATEWHFPSRALADTRRITLCKMHGSSNWVYCENCKRIFYDLDDKLSLRMKVGLIKADFRLLDERFSGRLFDSSLGVDPRARLCPACNNMVSSHIATFSYRKSFRTHAYTSIWHRAERILSDADRWVFVGYSLPKADYELKHLIKVAQLCMAHKRQNRKLAIDVVLKGNSALSAYEGFFGQDAFKPCTGGLEDFVQRSLL